MLLMRTHDAVQLMYYICVCHTFEHEFVAQGFLLCYNCYGPFYPSFAAFRASPCLEGL